MQEMKKVEAALEKADAAESKGYRGGKRGARTKRHDTRGTLKTPGRQNAAVRGGDARQACYADSPTARPPSEGTVT